MAVCRGEKFIADVRSKKELRPDRKPYNNAIEPLTCNFASVLAVEVQSYKVLLAV